MRTAAVLLLVRDPGRVERSLNSILPGREVHSGPFLRDRHLRVDSPTALLATNLR